MIFKRRLSAVANFRFEKKNVERILRAVSSISGRMYFHTRRFTRNSFLLSLLRLLLFLLDNTDLLALKNGAGTAHASLIGEIKYVSEWKCKKETKEGELTNSNLLQVATVPILDDCASDFPQKTAGTRSHRNFRLGCLREALKHRISLV